MSRRRDREKRVKRLHGLEVWRLMKVAPGSDERCLHQPEDFAAAGWRCPETDDQGACVAEIPF